MEDFRGGIYFARYSSADSDPVMLPYKLKMYN